MTQRIFDIENEKDMKDLWNILPEEVVKIAKDRRYWDDKYNKYKRKDGSDYTAGRLFNINWHDKTEITRPVNYEDMVGCVGYFWDNEDDQKRLGVFKYKDKEYFCDENESRWVHFIPAKKSELKFWGE